MDNVFYMVLKLEPIFYKMVYMSIVSSLIGIIFILIKKVLKNQISPKWISRIWLIFIISLIIPVQFKSDISIYNLIPLNLENIEDITVLRNQYLPNNEQVIEVNSSVIEKNIVNNDSNNNLVSILQYIPFLWLVISVICFIAYLLTYISFEIKIRKCKLTDSNLYKILYECKSKLNIVRNIKLVKQDIIKMPAIFGIFNVRVLVNDNILQLPEKEIKYIFIHELSHYKRKDNILNIAIMFLKCLYFFNPIIYILLNQVKNDLEIATDELAMQNESKEIQKEYSKTLVKLSAINSDKFLIQTMCLSDDKKNLERRIDSMKLINKFKKRKIVISIISITIICLIIAVFYARSNKYMSLQDIEKLYNKASKYTNVHYVKEESSYFLEKNEFQTIYEDYYCKDNIVYQKITNENGEVLSISYTNYDSNETITISNYDKKIYIYDIDYVLEENRNHIFGNLYTIKKDIFYEDKIYESKFEYYGKEKLNNDTVYKVEYNIVGESIKENVIEWIDKTKGVILKEEGIIYFFDDALENHNEKFIRNYFYEFNKVTNEDVEKPNLEEYTDYSIIEDVNYSTYY